ncbi:hypothetical protein J6590_063423 [Homalodisca vitripennis]|nr:hypothetical protein J6590_063423 [Homalodisca vitripennis]
MKKCNARGSAARDPHGIKQITVGPPHGIKQITMFIRENVDCRSVLFDSKFIPTSSPVLVDSLPRTNSHLSWDTPCPTRQSPECWASSGERLTAQYSTCKPKHVHTDTGLSKSHSHSLGLNFDGHGAGT